MILPTMNDKEKAYEAFRVTNWLCDFIEYVRAEVSGRFRRGIRFPYFQRYVVTDDKQNRWTVLFYQTSKTMRRKSRFFCTAYTTYDVPRRRVAYDVNAGRGCIMFDPLAMKRRVDGEKVMPIIADIVPHAFNRYTERHLKPLGKEGMEFGKKLEDMLVRSRWFDTCADICGDDNAAKHREGNICPYDIIMRDGGMLRGQIVHEMLIRISTYVSAEMFFDAQQRRQEELKSEFYRINTKKK